jgi:hypothetical protein
MRDRGMAMAILAAAGVAAAARTTEEDEIPAEIRYKPLSPKELLGIPETTREERRRYRGKGGYHEPERITATEANRRRNAAEEREKERRKRAEAKKARRRNGR